MRDLIEKTKSRCVFGLAFAYTLNILSCNQLEANLFVTFSATRLPVAQSAYYVISALHSPVSGPITNALLVIVQE